MIEDIKKTASRIAYERKVAIEKAQGKRKVQGRYTYVMWDWERDLYKIGKANDPGERESKFRTVSKSIACVLVCLWDVEYELHQKYKDKLVEGEWYRLTADDLVDLQIEYNFLLTEDTWKDDGYPDVRFDLRKGKKNKNKPALVLHNAQMAD